MTFKMFLIILLFFFTFYEQKKTGGNEAKKEFESNREDVLCLCGGHGDGVKEADMEEGRR